MEFMPAKGLGGQCQQQSPELLKFAQETNGPQRPAVGLFGQGRAGQLQAAVQAAGLFGKVGGPVALLT